MKKTAQDIREEFNKAMECLRKRIKQKSWKEKNSPLNKNTVKSYTSRLEQMENRILRLGDKIDIKEKPEDLLGKRLKSERNMQEFYDSIKRSKLQIMCIKEGEKVQVKGIHNIFNKIIGENFPNLGKKRDTYLGSGALHNTRYDQNKTSSWHIIVKTISTLNKERILKTVRQKTQITYKGKPIKITAYFSTKTWKE
jgi:hypothetical protein